MPWYGLSSPPGSPIKLAGSVSNDRSAAKSPNDGGGGVPALLMSTLSFGNVLGDAQSNPYKKQIIIYGGEKKEINMGVIAAKETPNGDYFITVELSLESGKKIRDAIKVEINYN